MTIRQNARAATCLMYFCYPNVSAAYRDKQEGILTTGTFSVSARSVHNWSTVIPPTHPIVNKPTHLTLTVAPKLKPVETSQNHQLAENHAAGPIAC